MLASDRDAGAFIRKFSSRASALLEGFEQWTASRKGVSSIPSKDMQRVGIGVYLFRESASCRTQLDSVSASRTLRRRRKRLRAP